MDQQDHNTIRDYSTGEVASILGVQHQRVRHYIYGGKKIGKRLNAVKVGHIWVVKASPAELDKLKDELVELRAKWGEGRPTKQHDD